MYLEPRPKAAWMEEHTIAQKGKLRNAWGKVNDLLDDMSLIDKLCRTIGLVNIEFEVQDWDAMVYEIKVPHMQALERACDLAECPQSAIVRGRGRISFRVPGLRAAQCSVYIEYQHIYRFRDFSVRHRKIMHEEGARRWTLYLADNHTKTHTRRIYGSDQDILEALNADKMDVRLSLARCYIESPSAAWCVGNGGGSCRYDISVLKKHGYTPKNHKDA